MATRTSPAPFHNQPPPIGTVEVRRRVRDEISDLVLCRRPAEDGSGGDEYITWNHNVRCGGYTLGHYEQTEENNDFDTR